MYKVKICDILSHFYKFFYKIYEKNLITKYYYNLCIFLKILIKKIEYNPKY